MAKFKEEYEKVFSALVNSNDSEAAVQKCRDLNAEIVANAAKVQSALKLADEDQRTIDKLKGEVEKAWKMVDASRRRRREPRRNVQALKKEVDFSKAAAQRAAAAQAAGAAEGHDATAQ